MLIGQKESENDLKPHQKHLFLVLPTCHSAYSLKFLNDKINVIAGPAFENSYFKREFSYFVNKAHWPCFSLSELMNRSRGRIVWHWQVGTQSHFYHSLHLTISKRWRLPRRFARENFVISGFDYLCLYIFYFVVTVPGL